MDSAYPLIYRVLAACLVSVCSSGCGSVDARSQPKHASSSGGSSPIVEVDTTSGGTTDIMISGSTSGSSGGGGNSSLAEWPPPGYVNVTNVSIGAYALGPEITGSAGASASGKEATSSACAGLFGIVRDFKMGNQPGGHPDFETASVADDKGIVARTLGPDGKPTYANSSGSTPSTTGSANFNQWYHDTPGVNRAFVLALHAVDNGSVLTFSASKDPGGGLPNSSFFPLDDQGFGNQGLSHNYSFTTEIHTSFAYRGGEVFTFSGDDDVWVFINKQLVIDLGGRHAQESASISLDQQSTELGLAIGKAYELAVFHAERHTTESDFRIDTTLAFTNCGEINGQIVY